MSEHLTTKQLAEFGERRLSPPETSAAARHLESCEVCRRDLRNLSPQFGGAGNSIRLDLAADEAEFHLDYDLHLRPFVDEQAEAATLEIVESHIADCRDCAAAVRDLREFRDNLRYAALQKAQSAKASGGWHFGWFVPVCAALVLFVTASTIWLLSRQNSNQIAPSVAVLPATNGETAPLAESNSNSSPVEQIAPNKNSNQTEKAQNPPNAETNLPNKLRIPAFLASLKTFGEDLRSGADDEMKINLFSPPAETIRAVRPIFRWRTNENAVRRVKIFDESGTKIAESPPLRVNFWQSDKSLERGRIYIWQIEVPEIDKLLSTAQFRVSSVAEEQLLNRLEKSGSPLEQAAAFAEAGLLTAAENKIRAELQKNPRSIKIRQWLEQIMAAKKQIKEQK